MSFGLGVIFFALGCLAIGLCVTAIPGRPGVAPPDHGHGHGGH